MVPYSADEQVKLAAFRRQRLWAHGALGLAAATLLATFVAPVAEPWRGMLRAAAEAGLVGGLADWFAVTALFRHPLGIPVWHTAIIPRRKAQIGREFGALVANRFLANDVLVAHLRKANIARWVSRLLAAPEVRARLAERIVRLLPPVADLLLDPEIRRMALGAGKRGLLALDLSGMAARAVDAFAASAGFEAGLDRLAPVLRAQLERSRPDIVAWLKRKTSDLLPNRVEGWAADLIMNVGDRYVSRLAEPDSVERAQLREALLDFADRLRAGAADELLRELVESGQTATLINAVLDDLHSRLTERNPAVEQGYRAALDDMFARFAASLADDPAARTRINHEVEALAASLGDDLRPFAARLISDTVAGWDTATLVRQAELAIGRDLQFVRINGTVVGALIGLGIYFLERMLTN